MSFEEARLRILEKVSAGELTPEAGQLEIAMLKVAGERQETATFSEPEVHQSSPGPSLGLLIPVLAFPLVIALLFTLFGLTLVLALPAYVFASLWNELVVPGSAGALPVLGFGQTLLGMMVAAGAIKLMNLRRRLVWTFGGRKGGEQ